MDLRQNGLEAKMDQDENGSVTENGSVADKVDGTGVEAAEMDQAEGEGFSPVKLTTKKKHGGHSVHRPNDTTRRQVNGMALAGLSHDRIARLIGISDVSLRKHYKVELENEGFVLGEIAQGLAQRAMDGDTVSSIFYLKARAGWRDQHVKIDQSVEVIDTAKHRLLDMLSAQNKIIEHQK